MNDKVVNSLIQLNDYRNKKVCVSFSGGKDSLVVLDLAIRAGISDAIFCDTGLEFDETADFVTEVEMYYGITIKTLKAPIDFYSLASKLGMPSRKCRWCTTVLKSSPQAIYAVQNGIEGFITGLRSEESASRKYYQAIDENPLVPVKQINPILDWTEEEVWKYIHEENLPINPMYELFDRVSCWCCPYKTNGEWELVKIHYPEKYEELITFLKKYAVENNISDYNQFINEMKWTSWSNPIDKVIAGSFDILYNHENHIMFDIMFNANHTNQIDKISNLFPIICDNFNIFTLLPNKKSKIKLEGNFSIRTLNILIEKAINCRGCGACLALCPENALFLDENTKLSVDSNKCTSCLDCLKTNKLKGGCIIRNFSRKRASLVQI
jgi:phosphoadenosine phosphosulfate reductase